MDRSPLVSIVTTCYRHEPYLDDYFHSLLSQTYSNVELIFIDDGSPDGSWEKAKQYENDIRSKFNRVVMMTQHNAGMHATLQRALTMATGEYVSILESDDYLSSTKIEQNVNHFLRHPGDGLVFSDYYLVYKDKIIHNPLAYHSYHSVPTGMVFDELLSRGNFLITCTACFRLEALRQYGRNAEYAERGYLMGDYPLWLDLARHVRFGFILDKLAYYRIHEGSASHPRDKKRQAVRFRHYHRVRLDYLTFCRTIEITSKVCNDILHHAYWTREAHLYYESLMSYWLAAKAFPTTLSAYIGMLKLLPHCTLAAIGLHRKNPRLFSDLHIELVKRVYATDV